MGVDSSRPSVAGESAEVSESRLAARDFVRSYLEDAESRLDAIPDPREAYASPTLAEALALAHERGFTTASLPSRFGGSGLSAAAQMAIVEELGQGAPGLSSHIMTCSLAATVIVAAKAHEKNSDFQDYIDDLTDPGTPVWGSAWAATEPAVGSDIFSFSTPGVCYSTRAYPDGDGYVLVGEKSRYVSNGYLADFFVVQASIGDAKDMSEAGVFLVPGNLPGVRRGEPLDKLGLRALNQSSIHFDEVKLPTAALAVPSGSGYQRFVERLTSRGNVAVGLHAIALAQRSYDIALEHVKTRVQGGKLLIEQQLVAHAMFTAYRQISAARALSRQVVARLDVGRVDPLDCYASRVQASVMAIQVVEQMVQMLGGLGITKDSPLERYYRDVKLLAIADGTVERIGLHAAQHL
ncbi:acyl-CoA dehydrogenase [Tsukamurella asaccharolytica]|uniref:Acyl-CoA dehydrogenase n=1 Tax=Tsukamurella asaccharolytica TaxID=2592067 RepID=A0A5C5R7Y5_9ACTN|nr:acyl-CoA dehydrogenase family protein [Tsukamurella asaccharolytica]TWS18433.1 acyl-CoA dehydrogenase [Tsukamurella asaccharolytica]